MTEQQANPGPTQDDQAQHPQAQHPQAQHPGQYGPYGQHPGGPYPRPPYKRLTRTSWDAPISGVCGGLARYFGIDPTLVRVLVVVGAVVTFPVGLIAYAVTWAVMPKE